MKSLKLSQKLQCLLFSKKTSKEGLQKIKKKFAEKGLKVSFSGVQRNDNDEITAIKIEAKADNGKSRCLICER